jgi:hypothetical protein
VNARCSNAACTTHQGRRSLTVRAALAAVRRGTTRG